jgi:hypothetical protein
MSDTTTKPKIEKSSSTIKKPVQNSIASKRVATTKPSVASRKPVTTPTKPKISTQIPTILTGKKVTITAKTTTGNKNVSTVQKTAIFIKLPGDLQLSILEFIGGTFNSVEEQVKLKDGEIVKKIIHQYYGRINGQIRFLYPYCNVPNASSREAYYLFPLLKHRRLEQYWFQLILPMVQQNTNYSTIIDLLKKSTSLLQGLTELDLVQIQTKVELFKEILSYTPNLKSLRCGVITFPKKLPSKTELLLKLEDVTDSIGNLTQLEEFLWKGMGLTETDVQKFASVKLDNLRVLCMQSHLGFGLFENAFKAFEKLQVVKITTGFGFSTCDNQIVTDVHQEQAFATLSMLQDLRVLSITGNEEASFPVASITKLTGHPSLAFMEIEGSICPEAIAVFASLSQLRILVLGSSCGFTSEDIAKLAPLKDTLQVLSVEQSANFGNVGCKAISNLTALRSLWLASFNDPISDVGGKALASLPNLERVDLSDTKISEKTLQALLKCPKLKAVKIDNCKHVNLRSIKEEQKFLNQEWPCFKFYGRVYPFNVNKILSDVLN